MSFHIKKELLTAAGLVFSLLLLFSCEGGKISTSLGLTPSAVNIPAAGGSAQVAFTAMAEWTASTAVDWIHLSQEEGESGDILLEITVDPNPSTSPRSSSISVSVESLSLLETVTVSQEASEAARLDISSTSFSYLAEGGSYPLTISTNRDWSASVDQSWVTLSATSGKPGADIIDVSCAANTSFEMRSAIVTVTAGEISKPLVITQRAAEKPEDPKVELSTSSMLFADEGGSSTVIVTSNQQWAASAESDWITLTPQEGVQGATAVVVSAKAYNGEKDRSARVVFTAGSASAALEVVQKAPIPVADDPVLELSTNVLSFSDAAVESSFTIITNRAWRASSSANWLTVSPSSGQAATSQVKIALTANTSEQSRSAIITVTADNLSAVLTVVQSGREPEPDPVLELSTTSLAFSEEGGQSTVIVTADTQWTAQCSESWVNISPKQGQAGNVQVSVTVPANPVTKDRSATIVFTAGKTTARLVVSQRAKGQEGLGGITGDIGDWSDDGDSGFNMNN